ncbi:MAG: hypothetical protein IMF07_08505 [Proteobacteria bacterium]|nr:hypothetical protein [Pseudomonadota bacterium]
MTYSKMLYLWSENPGLSIFIWAITAVAILYAARRQAHELILSVGRLVHKSMRLAARSFILAEKRLSARNKEVLLAAGEESAERIIEREFQRINSTVARDLSGYPTLQLELRGQIKMIDNDYSASADVPPDPPGWTKAVEAVANIPASGDTMVANLLGVINKSVNKQHSEAMDDYRKANGQRHSLLKKMLPYWRKMSNTLDEVDKTMAGLLERSKVIDSKMEEYSQIRKGTDKAIRTLSSSSLTQFFVAGFVVLIAMGGAVINFNLIALPMSEMVGGGSYVGPFKMSNIAAMVIILVEVAMGLFLLESLRITKLFPVIGALDDRMRTKMIWITFSILFILASIESSLAFMRDIIAADMQALRQSLSGSEVAAGASGNWIPTAGQMVMGFILPFALAFVAIPLESFVHSSRTVLGLVLVGILRGFSFLLRFVGNIAKSTGGILLKVYDLLVFAPLWIEHMITKNKPEKENQAILKNKSNANNIEGGKVA